MRNAALLRALAALIALGLVAVSCGDDDTPADTASAADTPVDDHDHDHDHAGDGHGGGDDHDHGPPVEIDAALAPSIELVVEADPAGGINVAVATTNFTVVADAASTEHVEGEGHFHLYIDGTRATRFYNDAIYYAGVTEGEVEVMVEVSANDHRAYAVDGEPIMAATTFTVPPHDHGDHDHGEAESIEWDGTAPELAIEVVADPMTGYNAFITVSGMTLSAENVNGDHVAGEGHLHIYANGQKLGRLYGSETHIPVLPEGEVEITVGAFTNDHRHYVLGGDPIEASTMITVSP
ncbi:MAG: hypothetical protein AAGA37_09020 [Actinomycetota bacterium]